jgi:hypothetical protein
MILVYRVKKNICATSIFLHILLVKKHCTDICKCVKQHSTFSGLFRRPNLMPTPIYISTINRKEKRKMFVYRKSKKKRQNDTKITSFFRSSIISSITVLLLFGYCYFSIHSNTVLNAWWYW